MFARNRINVQTQAEILNQFNTFPAVVDNVAEDVKGIFIGKVSEFEQGAEFFEFSVQIGDNKCHKSGVLSV